MARFTLDDFAVAYVGCDCHVLRDETLYLDRTGRVRRANGQYVNIYAPPTTDQPAHA